MGSSKYPIGHAISVTELLRKSPEEKACVAQAKKVVRSIRSSGLAEFKELLASGADPELTDEDGWPILFLAIRKGLFDHVKLLLDNGADVRRIAKEWTALHCAVMYKKTEIARLLIDSGVDVYYMSHGVTSALKMARFERANLIADFIEAKIRLDQMKDMNG